MINKKSTKRHNSLNSTNLSIYWLKGQYARRCESKARRSRKITMVGAWGRGGRGVCWSVVRRTSDVRRVVKRNETSVPIKAGESDLGAGSGAGEESLGESAVKRRTTKQLVGNWDFTTSARESVETNKRSSGKGKAELFGVCVYVCVCVSSGRTNEGGRTNKARFELTGLRSRSRGRSRNRSRRDARGIYLRRRHLPRRHVR